MLSADKQSGGSAAEEIDLTDEEVKEEEIKDGEQPTTNTFAAKPKGHWLKLELRSAMSNLHKASPDHYCFGEKSHYTRASPQKQKWSGKKRKRDESEDEGELTEKKESEAKAVNSCHLRLPLRSSDTREKSWYTVIDNIINHLGNNPTSREQCWLYKLPHFEDKSNSDGTRASKKQQKDPHAGGAKVSIEKNVTSKAGVGPKSVKYIGTWKLHRVVHAMYHPHMFERVSQFKIPADTHLSHRCAHGQRGFPHEAHRDNICINPFHARYLYETQNYDEKFCGNGCFDFCPHFHIDSPSVRCLWAWRDTGELKRCRSFPAKEGRLGYQWCKCERNCFLMDNPQRAHLDQTFADASL
jgi:hypothetical protein